MRQPDITLNIYLTEAGYQADLFYKEVKIVERCRSFPASMKVGSRTLYLGDHLLGSLENFRKDGGPINDVS
jgi:hypothetical protein